MSQIRAVLCGYYGKGNGGDEALLASLLQMLPDRVTPVVLSGNPEATRDRYGVESCDRFSAFAVLQALRSSQAFIWGGGSLMQDVTSSISPLYYGGLMALAQQQGLTTMAWAQGLGPLNRRLTREIAKRTLQGCAAVSVRDRASAQLAADWNVNPLLAPDPVWALEEKPVAGLGNLPSPQIAVTLRSHPQLTPQRLHTLTQALIHLQKATEACILLVPFQRSRDLDIARAIASQLPGTREIVLLDDPGQLKGLYRGVEMAIGMRLHSLIMAASQQCRCFAISYDPKVTQLMAELNLPGWELDRLPEDANTMSTAWLKEFVNGEATSRDRIQSLRDRALLHRELLVRAFNSY
ncbi:MAG: polysaccharide pyruvyl transferase CsaB [Cyanobacteriota bacterium]|nr:polysaccharide pyruvyl transferase CsaB [Cyanobacteriota bacterium]